MPKSRDNPEETPNAPIELNRQDAASLKRLLSLFESSPEAVPGAQPQAAFDDDADLLFRKAQWMRAFRLRRRDLLPDALFGEPAWDVLIELYLAHGRKRMSITGLAEGTGVALATLLRWVQYLTQNRLVTATKSPTDARVRFIDLSGKGVTAMTSFLRTLPPMPD